MKRFKAVVCANCGCVQSTEAVSVIKCKRCGKNKQFKKLKILKTFDTGKQAALFVQEYTKLKWKQSK
ncbi:DUF1922 domain-containing protein [Candidatus Woesearchaeota archaeon]|nr:DUF1922 domain-containing protein [Candidatus Woesearchaeota archaeon]